MTLYDPDKILFEKAAAADPMGEANKADANVTNTDPLFLNNSLGGAYSSPFMNKISPVLSKVLGVAGIPWQFHGERDVLPNMIERMDPQQAASDLQVAMQHYIPATSSYPLEFTANVNNRWRQYNATRMNPYGRM